MSDIEFPTGQERMSSGPVLHKLSVKIDQLFKISNLS